MTQPNFQYPQTTGKTGVDKLLLTCLCVVTSCFLILSLVVGALGVFFSGPSAKEESDAGAYPTLPADDTSAHFVEEGGNVDFSFDNGVGGSCTIGGVGADQNGSTVILLARHCLHVEEGGPRKVTIAGADLAFETIVPDMDDEKDDFAFVRILQNVNTKSHSTSLSTDHVRLPRDVCKVGVTTRLTCGKLMGWTDGHYLSSAMCLKGDSGGAMTSVDRLTIFGVVTTVTVRHPGIMTCGVYPSYKIVDAISAGKVPGITKWDPGAIPTQKS